MSDPVPLLPVTGAQLARLEEIGADVSPLYQALANSPILLGAWLEFAWTLREQAVTPRALRELMILRCAQLSGSAYQWADHAVMAKEAGVAGEKIDGLADWRRTDRFTDTERCVLRFVEEVVAGHVADETIDLLVRRFDAQGVVELTLTASFYVMVPRVLDALRLPRGG